MMVDVRDLSFGYGDKAVLDRISFTARRGKVCAVLGTNGTGKTTLLKCINRILTPQGGGVWLEEQAVADLKPRQLAQKIGYVDQLRTGYQARVFDAVLLGRKPHMQWDVSQRDIHIAQQALADLGLEDFAPRHLDQLSGGELQKVVIARALAQEPQLLLMDEPTSCLDLRNQLDVLRIIRKITQERQMSTVVTLHDLNLALRFADTFILLKDQAVYALGGREVLSPENIQAVYSVPVMVVEHQGRLCVIPL